jgi:hypothetical protein
VLVLTAAAAHYKSACSYNIRIKLFRCTFTLCVHIALHLLTIICLAQPFKRSMQQAGYPASTATDTHNGEAAQLQDVFKCN